MDDGREEGGGDEGGWCGDGGGRYEHGVEVTVSEALGVRFEVEAGDNSEVGAASSEGPVTVWKVLLNIHFAIEGLGDNPGLLGHISREIQPRKPCGFSGCSTVHTDLGELNS